MLINDKEQKIIKKIHEITGKKIDIEKKVSYDLVKHFRIFKIKKILFISSTYDYFLIDEDGRLNNLFKNWNLINSEDIPQITHIENEKDAISKIKSEHFNLIIIFNQNDSNINSLIKKISNITTNPIALIVNNIKQIEFISNNNKKKISKIFTWNGDGKIILTIIQYFEDQKNLIKSSPLDYKKCILLIEDSIQHYSTYLQIIYEEIHNYTKEIIHDQLNNEKKNLRYKRKPFIIHSSNYDESLELFKRFKEDIICIISDQYIQENSKRKNIGNKIIESSINYDPKIPILIQSSEPLKDSKKLTNENIKFLLKSSNNRKQVIRKFIKNNIGNPKIIIKDKENNIKFKISKIKQFEKELKLIDEEDLINLTKKRVISNWLEDIGEIEFSKKCLIIEEKCKDKNKIKEQLMDLIEDYNYSISKESIDFFSRRKDIPLAKISRIGNGALGGKARGIAFVAKMLSKYLPEELFKNLKITIPRSIVISTDIFDMFMDHNNLSDLDFYHLSDHRIASKFIESDLPATILGDLRAFITNTRKPMIVRSSGLLEDSLMQPFAGIYESVIFPNESWETDVRFQEICNSIKYVYSSTYFEKARTYIKNTTKHLGDEKMAILIQEVSGDKHENYFYPTISGVAKSFNYYPSGPCKQEEGIVYLALGLGKSIVDGGSSFAFCPERPRVPIFGTPKEYMKYAQSKYYALNLKSITKLANFNEEIFLEKLDIETAKKHGTLDSIASTYFYQDDRLVPGLHEDGYTVIDFAPITEFESLNLVKAIKLVMQISEIALGYAVEIEFALNVSKNETDPNELLILQIRNMIPPEKNIDIDLKNIKKEKIILNSNNSLGNGIIKDIKNILYVDQEQFDLSKSKIIVAQIRDINTRLMKDNKPYILIGPGRWGSTDPWLGIPIIWSDIAGVKVIVETPYKEHHIDPSQGSHFFHDMIASQVIYLITKNQEDINWHWIKKHKLIEQTEYLKLLEIKESLKTIADGKKGIGLILKQNNEEKD